VTAIVTDPRSDLSEPLTEAQLQAAVIDTAHVFGWRVAHFRPAKTSRGWRTAVAADGKGFPDLVLVHPGTGRLLFSELKSYRGKPTAEQEQWLIALERTDAEVYVWTPSDWPALITRALSGRDVLGVA
jgi:hypothetical protein